MPDSTINQLIDAADALLPLHSTDDAWLRSVDLIEQSGGNALNVTEINQATNTPLWVRSSMSSQWMEDYLKQDFYGIDPVVQRASKGHLLSRAVKGQVEGIEGSGPRTDSFRDQLTSWHYHTIDFHLFSTGQKNIVKGISVSYDHAAVLPSSSERLLCAMIASVVSAPSGQESPGATSMQGHRLTGRERDALRYLAAGLRNDAIAWKLGIAEVTVRLHISSARRKLGAATREQAIALAIKSGQLPL